MQGNTGVRDWLMGLMGLRGAGNESTTQEQYHDPIALHHGLRVRQWLAAMVAGMAAFGGLYLLALPLHLSGTVETAFDALLMGVLSALAGLIWFAAVELCLHEYARWGRRVVEMMGDMLILGALAMAAVRAAGELRWWHSWAIVAGVSVFVPSVGLAFNQARELFDPLGWTSPYEQGFLSLFRKLLGMETDQPQIVERPVIPWRHAINRGDSIARRQAEKEGMIEIPAADDLNLADFLEEAVRRGLGRAAWLKKGHARYQLPTTGERVTRSTYDRMIQMAIRYGYVEGGGDGDATAWRVEPDAAYEDWVGKVAREWPDVLVGEEE